MSKKIKLFVPLFFIPLVFSCGSEAIEGSNRQLNSLTNSNGECLINISCKNAYASFDAGESWSNSFSTVKPSSQELTIRFKPAAGYTLPSGLYKFVDEGGEAITDYSYDLVKSTGYRDLVFTPTSSTVIEVLADNDCFEMDLTTTTDNEQVGFSYNGSLEYVDWGDGMINQETSHVYSTTGKRTVKVAGTIRSFTLGQPNTSNAFYPGNLDINKIIINKDVNLIKPGSFSGCSGLKELYVGDSVTNILPRSFTGCTNLTNIAFSDKSNYKSISGSDVVDKTSNTLIYSKTGMELDSSITAIGEYAYEGCDLSSLKISSNITAIGNCAFYNCKNLTSLDLTSCVMPPELSDYTFDGSSIRNFEVADSNMYHQFYINEKWGNIAKEGKITYPSDDCFEILPLEDAEIGLVGVSNFIDSAPREIYLSIKNGNSGSWSDKISLTGVAATTSTPVSTDNYLADVQANNPLFIKGVNNTKGFGKYYCTGSKIYTYDSDGYWTFYCRNKQTKEPVPFKVSGKILSLMSEENVERDSIWSETVFPYLFYQNTSLIDASKLIMPNDTSTSCYLNMFNGCTSLVNAPSLPANLSNSSMGFPPQDCYEKMFANCTSLEAAPELPSTVISYYCYYAMFQNCTNLKIAPTILPAKEGTSKYAYSNMFQNCEQLKNPPKIELTTLDESTTGVDAAGDYLCYYMFSGCTSLESAPELHATNLAEYCYCGMFRDCTSLKVPNLIHSTGELTTQCFYGMFQNCTSLVHAPTLVNWKEMDTGGSGSSACEYMFYGCTSLIEVPRFPVLYARTPTRQFMGTFRNCSSLHISTEASIDGRPNVVCFVTLDVSRIATANIFVGIAEGATPSLTQDTTYYYIPQ